MSEDKTLTFVKISENPVVDFLKRYFIGDIRAKSLVIISPIITDLSKTRFSLQRLKTKIESNRTLTYVITRKPQENFHKEAIDILMKSSFVEIRYNNSLHAKLYVCCEDEPVFAVLGSGNLSRSSMIKNIEIGMIVFPYARERRYCMICTIGET